MNRKALLLLSLVLMGCSAEPPAADVTSTPVASAPAITAEPTTMADFPPAGTGDGGAGGGPPAGVPRIPSEWKPRDPSEPAAFDKTYDHLPGYAEALAARNTAPVTASTVKRGAALFKANCAPCHGAEGHGDGPSAALLREPLRDLSNVWLYKYGASDQALFRSNAYGIPGSAMGEFKGGLKVEDMWSQVV